MPLTVIQVLPALEVGGVERGTVDVAAALVRQGHRAIVVSAPGRLVAELETAGAEHIGLPVGVKSPASLRLIPRLQQVMETSAADIIHARSRFPAWLSYLAWRTLPPRRRPGFVTTVHGPYSVNAYSRVMTFGERVIAISDFIRDYIVANYARSSPEKIAVIHRGIDPVLYRRGRQPSAAWLAEWRRTQPQLAGRFVIVLPARITRWKGQQDFLLVLRQVRDAGVPVHGLVVGGAEPRRRRFLQQLRAQVRRDGLQDAVSFLHHRDDLREIMTVADVVLSLAREPEAFGRTAVEALALGTPVVAYDHGGAREVLRAMLPGGLVPPLSPQAAALRVAEYYRSPPQVTAPNPFTLDKMLDKTLALYEALALTVGSS